MLPSRKGLLTWLGRRRWINWIPSTTYLLLLFYIPIAMLMYYSFWRYLKLFRFEPALTLENYLRFFTSPIYTRVLLNTIFIVGVAMALLLIVGFPIAYFIARYVRSSADRIILLMLIPVEINYLIRIFAWRTILGENGILNSFLVAVGVIEKPLPIFFYNWFAIVIVTMHEWLPYVVIPLYISLRSIPRSLYEAAHDLGASRLQTFLKITLPLCKPGILTAIFIVFIPALGEFAIPALVGGKSGYMIGNMIENQLLAAGNWPLATAASVILLATSLIIVGIMVKILGMEALYR
ncbi:MAG TPA: ABC transporter permease [Candidatus Caldiarchaeum subterraneum]|uniref:ABC transporter permease n=1 Tax=Caldiarchaeum subterraneum TaxID=311458 RepID=A0A833EBW9_CALS0|nr:ABC transporter permease [Aigarchaeota archaeon]HIQ29704.1 ABC transporter permease [Candidatus Caldarchaeum subterraneum]